MYEMPGFKQIGKNYYFGFTHQKVFCYHKKERHVLLIKSHFLQNFYGAVTHNLDLNLVTIGSRSAWQHVFFCGYKLLVQISFNLKHTQLSNIIIFVISGITEACR